MAPGQAIKPQQVSLGSLAPRQVRPQDVYSGLVAETLRALIQEALVLGLFIVGVGNLRIAAKDPEYLKSASFAKHIVILSGIALFVTYMKLSYSVEWALSPEDVIRQARTTFTERDRDHSALMVILLVPVDLAIVILMAVMFLILAKDDYFGGQKTILDEVKSLYKVTAATHIATMIWWMLFGFLTGELASRMSDIGYHGFFAFCHIGGLLIIKQSMGKAQDKQYSAPSEWWHVAIYTSLLAAVYISRMWIYIHRYTENHF